MCKVPGMMRNGTGQSPFSNHVFGLRVELGYPGSDPDGPVFGLGDVWNRVDPGWHIPLRCRFN
jgi:hypothetical protein